MFKQVYFIVRRSASAYAMRVPVSRACVFVCARVRFSPSVKLCVGKHARLNVCILYYSSRRYDSQYGCLSKLMQQNRALFPTDQNSLVM